MQPSAKGECAVARSTSFRLTGKTVASLRLQHCADRAEHAFCRSMNSVLRWRRACFTMGDKLTVSAQLPHACIDFVTTLRGVSCVHRARTDGITLTPLAAQVTTEIDRQLAEGRKKTPGLRLHPLYGEQHGGCRSAM